MKSRALLIAAFAAALAVPAFAQAPEGTPVRLRGTVDKLDGETLLVKSRDGTPLTIALAPNVAVSGVAKKTLADIHQGDYVASTSIKEADGKLHALEVHIFPEAMRGTGEGQFPWDLQPASLMTNATVSGIATGADGETLKVTYKGSESDVVVGPDTPIVTFVPGDKTLLKPGAAVFIFALKKPDGSLSTSRITAEKDGVKPPM